MRCDYDSIRYIKGQTHGRGTHGTVTWYGMCTPSDIATVSIIKELCMQRENHLMTLLQPHEVEDMLLYIRTE